MNILSIQRNQIVRMVSIAHRNYEWEVAEFVTRLAMLFGPNENTICLDRLTLHNDWMFGRVREVQAEV